MKNLIIALSVISTLSTLEGAASAQPTDPNTGDCTNPCVIQPTPAAAPGVAPPTVLGFAEPQTAPAGAPSRTLTSVPQADDGDSGWHKPVGRRFLHGFRIGWTYIANYDRPTREGGKSLKEELGLKTPNMMLLGYEGFYRIVGHSWLNVLMVGNVTVVGLEQSKFIPAASALIGFEFNRSFQLGVGVNLLPDAQSPSHMIVAAGWTPTVGSIQTPLHFFYVPDADHNSRIGATIGMTW